jgi:hypothetical protein
MNLAARIWGSLWYIKIFLFSKNIEFDLIFFVYRAESKTGQSYYGPKARKPHDSYGFFITFLTVMKKTVWIVWFPCFWPVIALTRFRLCTVFLYGNGHSFLIGFRWNFLISIFVRVEIFLKIMIWKVVGNNEIWDLIFEWE